MAKSEDFLSASAFASRTAEVLDNVEQTKRPTILTENGEAKAVLLDFDSYRELRRQSASAREENLRQAGLAGQDPEILEKIRAGLAHPAMAAFGLFKDEPDFEDAVEQARHHRPGGRRRPDLKL